MQPIRRQCIHDLNVFTRPCLLVCLCILAISCHCSDVQAQEQERTIKIGLLCDMSGFDARLCKAAALGARSAVNAANLEDWAKTRPLELIASDTSGDPAKVLPKAEGLVKEQGVVAIIGPEGPGGPDGTGQDAVLDAFKKLGAALHVPVILMRNEEIFRYSTGNEGVRNWTFTVAPDINSEIKALCRWLSAGPPSGPLPAKKRTLFAIVPDSPVGQKITLLLKAYGIECGIKAISSSIALNQADLSSSLSLQFKKAKSEMADVVAAFGLGRSALPTLIRSASEAGVNLAVSAAMLNDETPKEAGATARFFIIAPPLLANQGLKDDHPCKVAVIRFELDMGNKIDNLSPAEMLAAGAGWDAINLLAAGIKNLQTLDADTLLKAIEGLNAPYAGVMGLIRPSETVHTGPLPESLIVVEKKAGTSFTPEETYKGPDLQLPNL
ncbi:ABC transporter substrate-binding protein [Dissulfurimicrobium hydrothermale]|uniref:ABC transporter substrate-binding protein n=1 Tax=Dissulfurimicrobium hydrothermale TaxID=1750598 RepID=UPI001EDB80C3|nr:ABC transporter substrate-binding protein [Dissulfurimicrobium hydrothermale]UKL14355.1 ABC transporter substrate-binding protein [Dissulfurimicrobium hydrothermale]